MTEFDEALQGSQLTEAWTIGAGINGGFAMALMADRLRDTVSADGRHPDAVALSAYFLSATRVGSFSVSTELVRSGRTMSTGQVCLTQEGSDGTVERIRALATFADLDEMSEPMRRQAEPPSMPPPEQCLGFDDVPADAPMPVPPILHRLDMRFDPATAMWAIGQPSKQGRMRAWVRFQDGREPDALSLLFFLDAMPPVAFDLGLTGWAPTLEFTAHVRARPAPGWLLVELSTDNFSAGLLEEDARIWDSTGRLVAQSRQLAGVRVP